MRCAAHCAMAPAATARERERVPLYRARLPYQCGHIATIYSRLAARISAERAHKTSYTHMQIDQPRTAAPYHSFGHLIRVTLRGAALHCDLSFFAYVSIVIWSTQREQRASSATQWEMVAARLLQQLNKLCTVAGELFAIGKNICAGSKTLEIA